MKIKSNLLSNGDQIPPTGFITATIVVRALSLAMMPAFATEMVCCSIASWMEVRSSLDMQPNSSIQHTPRSASANAPASSENSLPPEPDPSRTAAQVRPALEDPGRWQPSLDDAEFRRICLGSHAHRSKQPASTCKWIDGNARI